MNVISSTDDQPTNWKSNQSNHCNTQHNFPTTSQLQGQWLPPCFIHLRNFTIPFMMETAWRVRPNCGNDAMILRLLPSWINWRNKCLVNKCSTEINTFQRWILRIKHAKQRRAKYQIWELSILSSTSSTILFGSSSTKCKNSAPPIRSNRGNHTNHRPTLPGGLISHSFLHAVVPFLCPGLCPCPCPFPSLSEDKDCHGKMRADWAQTAHGRLQWVPELELLRSPWGLVASHSRQPHLLPRCSLMRGSAIAPSQMRSAPLRAALPLALLARILGLPNRQR